MTENQLTTIQEESNLLVTQASEYQVTNQLNYDAAAGFLKNCLLLKKKVELFFEPTIKKFKEAKKAAEDGRRAEVERMEKYLCPITDAIALVQKKCKDFENEQEKIRIAEQKRLDEEAKKKAEEEKKKLEEQAEVEKAWGDAETAEEIKAKAAAVEVEEVKAKPVIAKTTGLGIRRVWTWRIVNAAQIPREYLKIDEVAINKVVRELKDKTNIPGIEAYED